MPLKLHLCKNRSLACIGPGRSKHFHLKRKKQGKGKPGAPKSGAERRLVEKKDVALCDVEGCKNPDHYHALARQQPFPVERYEGSSSFKAIDARIKAFNDQVAADVAVDQELAAQEEEYVEEEDLQDVLNAAVPQVGGLPAHGEDDVFAGINVLPVVPQGDAAPEAVAPVDAPVAPQQVAEPEVVAPVIAPAAPQQVAPEVVPAPEAVPAPPAEVFFGPQQPWEQFGVPGEESESEDEVEEIVAPVVAAAEVAPQQPVVVDPLPVAPVGAPPVADAIPQMPAQVLVLPAEDDRSIIPVPGMETIKFPSDDCVSVTIYRTLSPDSVKDLSFKRCLQRLAYKLTPGKETHLDTEEGHLHSRLITQKKTFQFSFHEFYS